MPAQQYRILVSGSAPALYPTDTFFGLLYYNRDEALEIPKRYPYSGEWGKPLSRHLMDRERYPMPGLLDIVWLSVTEGVFYSLMKILPTEQMEQLFSQTDKENGEPLFEHIVVGMAPYGGVAVWTHGDKKSVLVGWYHAQEIEVDMKDFMPLNPTVTLTRTATSILRMTRVYWRTLKKTACRQDIYSTSTCSSSTTATCRCLNIGTRRTESGQNTVRKKLCQ